MEFRNLVILDLFNLSFGFSYSIFGQRFWILDFEFFWSPRHSREKHNHQYIYSFIEYKHEYNKSIYFGTAYHRYIWNIIYATQSSLFTHDKVAQEYNICFYLWYLLKTVFKSVSLFLLTFIFVFEIS